MSLVINAAVCNDIGYSRDNNEDNFYLDGTYLAKENMDKGGVFAIDASTECALFVVCDGMGGENKGEDASFSAVQTFDELRDELTEGRTKKVFSLINRYVNKANKTVNKLVEDGHAGSTMVMLCFYDDEAFCASLGDSRLYVLRDGKLKLISYDHTEAGQLVSAGVLTPDEAKGSIYKNVLTKYLGMPINKDMNGATNYADFVLHYGDRFLLCSDGLSDMVEDASLKEILKKKLKPQKTASLLVAKALENGGRDNITAMVVDVEREDAQAKEEYTTKEEVQTKSIEEPALEEQAAPTVATKYIFDDDSLTLETPIDKKAKIANTIEKMLSDVSHEKGLLEAELEYQNDELVVVENINVDQNSELGLLEQEIDKKGLLEQQLEFQSNKSTIQETKDVKDIALDKN